MMMMMMMVVFRYDIIFGAYNTGLHASVWCFLQHSFNLSSAQGSPSLIESFTEICS